MYAEEYLVDRIQKLENENTFLKSSNERKLVEILIKERDWEYRWRDKK